MIYLKLFITFFKIACFSFGGGLAMLPLIQTEILLNSWMTESEFMDIVVISQMTPGSIIVNSATFVGNKVAGIPGAAFATFGVVLPSLIIIIGISGILKKLEENNYKKSFFFFIKPVVISLILYSGMLIGRNSLIIKNHLNSKAIILTILIFLITLKNKFHPIFLIICSGIIGIFLF